MDTIIHAFDRPTFGPTPKLAFARPSVSVPSAAYTKEGARPSAARPSLWNPLLVGVQSNKSTNTLSSNTHDLGLSQRCWYQIQRCWYCNH